MMLNWLKSGKLESQSQEQSSCYLENSNCLPPTLDSTDIIGEENKAGTTSRKKRKYDEDYLNFGFTWTGDKDEPNGLCVICEQVVNNSSLNPAKLKRHLDTKHPTLKGKSEYFKRKCNELNQKKHTFERYVRDDNKNLLKASYLVSLRIAKQGEAYTIAEKLIKPCTKDLTTCVFGEKFASKVDLVPLSDTTISRRIEDMSYFCEAVLVNRLKNAKCGFTLQMDESTDVAGLAILLVFVRYIHESSFEEDMLFCKALPTQTTGEEIFNLLNAYFEKHSIPWNLCYHICTDGAKAMVGVIKGVIARIKKLVPDIKASHCCLHRHALAVKRIPNALHEVLNDAVKMINFIKSRPLNARVFALLCDDLGSLHKNLLLHTEVRWLSRGKVLTRFWELRDEIRIFFNEREFAGKLNDTSWLQNLAYIADIFSYLNEVNLSLQGPNSTIFKVNSRINSIKSKLKLWEECITKNNTECFANLNDFLETSNTALDPNLKSNILEHLNGLKNTFLEYFPPTCNNISWVENPFNECGNVDTLPIKEREQLIDIRTDTTLKSTFVPDGIGPFWIKLMDEFPEISKRAVKELMPFVTTYLCEKSFSVYVATKTKYRNRLDAEDDMRLQLTTIHPDIDNLCNNKQAQKSH